MANRIRFHLDEHVDPAVAIALRRAGIDVTTTNEVGLRTKDDATHFNFARDEGRIQLTLPQRLWHERDSSILTSTSLCWINNQNFGKQARYSFHQAARCLALDFQCSRSRFLESAHSRKYIFIKV